MKANKEEVILLIHSLQYHIRFCKNKEYIKEHEILIKKLHMELDKIREVEQ